MNPQARSGGVRPDDAVSDSSASTDSGPSTQRRSGAQEPSRIVDELAAMGLTDAHEIGHGGFGVVYRCLQRSLERVVAVKVLSEEIDSESRERFLREEQAMGRLSGHPNIVEILQVDVTPSGLPLIVMPYCTRGSLEQVVQRYGPLTWADTLRAGVKLAGAIESAHRARILHRDVKPANILLSGYGEPQLTDFGIARITGGFQTSSSLITGSPAFTAPEVLKGAVPTVSSDVYGLGATLFALLTGHAAFERKEGEKVVAQFLRITTQPVPDLREQDIPADVADVIARAMAMEPSGRPGSAYEFGELLRTVQRAHAQVPDEMALLDAVALPEAITRAATGGTEERNDAETGVSARHSWPLNVSAEPQPTAIGLPPTETVAQPTGSFVPPTATTKFRPATPARDPVPRPRLLEALRAGGRRRLAVIHAPAGFGKSTVAAQWRTELADAGMPVAWISVNRDDNNEIWFLAHLVEAIRRVYPAVGAGLGQVLEERPSDAAAFVISTLIDEIHAAATTIVVIIDDWHRVTDADARQAMAALLDNGCHHLRFVVTSREQTGLPTSRMRVHDELVEIGSTALRMTSTEIRQVLVGRNGNPLTDAQVEQIRAATDGWPAAIQLIGLALRGNVDPGTLIDNLAEGNHGIREYLAENVLDTLEPEMLRFLTSISVTERVSGALAAALSGDDDAERLLEQAEQRELFVRRIAHDPEWFRMQPLFAEHLRARLERTRPGALKALHRKAARWYAEHQLLRKSVDHALEATDLKMALDLIESGGMDLIDGSRLSTLLGTVSKLPVQQVASRSKLLMAVARANLNVQQAGAARTALGKLSNMLARGAATEDKDRQRCQAAVLAASDQIVRDRTDGVLERLAGCMERPEELPVWTVSTAANLTTFVRLCEFDFDGAREVQQWAAPFHAMSKDPLGTVFGLCGQGAAAYEQLDIVTATTCFQQAWEVAQARSGPRSQAVRVASALLGEASYRRGDLAEADQLLDESHELVTRVGPVDFLISSFVTGARVKAARGEMATALARLDEGAQIAVDNRLVRLAAHIRAERVRLGAGVDGIGAARADQRSSGHTGRRLTGSALLAFEAEEVAQIRVLLADHRLESDDQAVRRARALRARRSENDRPRAQLDAALLLAECLAASGWVGEAADLLVPAAAHCAELGWTRPLLDAGPGVVGILGALRDDGAANAELPTLFLAELLEQGGQSGS